MSDSRSRVRPWLPASVLALRHVGAENIQPHVQAALERVAALVADGAAPAAGAPLPVSVSARL